MTLLMFDSYQQLNLSEMLGYRLCIIDNSPVSIAQRDGVPLYVYQTKVAGILSAKGIDPSLQEVLDEIYYYYNTSNLTSSQVAEQIAVDFQSETV